MTHGPDRSGRPVARVRQAIPPSILATLLLLASGAAAPAASQRIGGVALDTAGQPVADVPVALHRIGGTSAMSVATSVTDAEGRFAFDVQAADSAVYFAAMRFGEALYIGPPVRAGIESREDYVLRASPETEAGAVASALSGRAPAGTPPTGPARAVTPTNGSAAWLVLFLAAGAAIAFVLAAPAYRRRKRRDMMIELATVENELARPDPPAERDSLEERRAVLRGQLGPAG